MRPVVVLGPHAEPVCDKLVVEWPYKFARALPGKFSFKFLFKILYQWLQRIINDCKLNCKIKRAQGIYGSDLSLGCDLSRTCTGDLILDRLKIYYALPKMQQKC